MAMVVIEFIHIQIYGQVIDLIIHNYRHFIAHNNTRWNHTGYNYGVKD